MKNYVHSLSVLSPILSLTASLNHFITFLVANGANLDSISAQLGASPWFPPAETWNFQRGFGLLCSFAPSFCNSADDLVSDGQTIEMIQADIDKLKTCFPSGTSEKLLIHLR